MQHLDFFLSLYRYGKLDYQHPDALEEDYTDPGSDHLDLRPRCVHSTPRRARQLRLKRLHLLVRIEIPLHDSRFGFILQAVVHQLKGAGGLFAQV